MKTTIIFMLLLTSFPAGDQKVEKEIFPENIEYCQNLAWTDSEKFEEIGCDWEQTQRSFKIDFNTYYNK